MAVKIAKVNTDSLCSKKGITEGYVLLSVNGHEINDVLDYRFYANEKRLSIDFLDKNGEKVTLRLKSHGNLKHI